MAFLIFATCCKLKNYERKGVAEKRKMLTAYNLFDFQTI